MTLKGITNGSVVDHDVGTTILRGITASLFNLQRTLMDRTVSFSAKAQDIWGDAYTGSTGRMASINTSLSTAFFNTNKYEVDYFIEINATSLTIANFAINNCVCVNISTGVWILHCTTGSYEVRRAQVLKTLFYGTNGTDPRGTASYITGLTAFKVSDPRDVGKRAYYISYTKVGTTPGQSLYTGTFSNVTDNTDCSVWSVCYSSPATYNYSYFEMPSGNILNSVYHANSTVDETGLDKTADMQNNPADFALRIFIDNTGYYPYIKSYVLCKGTVSMAETGVTATKVFTDFFSSISALTLSTLGNTIVHSIPTGMFPAGVSSFLANNIIAAWDEGADIQLKLQSTTNVAYASSSFSVTTQASTPNGMAFSADGTKMYIINSLVSASSAIYQYDLRTAWDPTTAYYVGKYLTVGGQDTNPRKMWLSSDGTKMYVLGGTNKTVYQYTLSTAWQINTGSYASKSFSVATQAATQPQGITFNATGSIMYVGDQKNSASAAIYQYTLSTPWDVSTASYASKSVTVGGTETAPAGIFMKSDGTKLFMIGNTTNVAIYQYNLSVAEDISTAAYYAKYVVSSQDSSPQQAWFNSTGDSFFVLGYTNDTVYKYSVRCQLFGVSAGVVVDDSGYFSIIKMTDPATFTAFTYAPDTAYVSLVAKNDRIWTPGSPSAYGTGVYTE